MIDWRVVDLSATTAQACQLERNVEDSKSAVTATRGHDAGTSRREIEHLSTYFGQNAEHVAPAIAFHFPCWADCQMSMFSTIRQRFRNVRASEKGKREHEAIGLLCTNLEPQLDLLSDPWTAFDRVLLGLFHSNGGGIALAVRVLCESNKLVWPLAAFQSLVLRVRTPTC